MDDPYKILGVARDADAAALRTAYRKLAKTHHPDLNPGDKAAEERFKAISVAYNFLSDAEQRAKFDRGEIEVIGRLVEQQHFGFRGQRLRQREAFFLSARER